MADTNVITIADNSQIKFLHGLQTALDAKRTARSGESGTFYLTNDTHRLYVGLSDGSIEAVNEGITTYANVEALPTATALNAGQFVYITADSILAVSNGQNWVQINANTNTTYTYGGLVTGEQTGTVTVTTTLTEIGEGNRKPSFAFSLTGKNGITIVEGTTDGTIEVYGTKLASENMAQDNAAKIKLVNEAGVQQSAVVIQGGTNVTVSEDNGVIGITAVDTKLDGNTDGGSNLAQGFQILAKDTANRTSGGKIDPIIKYGDGGNASVHFVNGTATLDVYTKAQVDALRADFDAMEYQGVVNSIPTGSIKKGYTYKVGQAFDVTVKTDTGTEEITVQPGDLLIAEGTEGTNGFLTTVQWGYVPSGNEDTTYSVGLLTPANGGGIQLLEKKTGTTTGTNAGSISVLSGNCITVSPSSDTASKAMSLTINHNAVSTTDPARDTTGTLNNPTLGADYVAKSEDIIIIDASKGENGIDRDNYGHVQKVYTKTVKVYDTNARLTGMTSSVSSDTAKTKATVSIKGQVTGSKNQKSEQTATFYVESTHSNLQVSSSGSSVQMSLVWGTF